MKKNNLRNYFTDTIWRIYGMALLNRSRDKLINNLHKQQKLRTGHRQKYVISTEYSQLHVSRFIDTCGFSLKSPYEHGRHIISVSKFLFVIVECKDILAAS